jgi:5-methylcytosine-specific restriction endonuclease McrA
MKQDKPTQEQLRKRYVEDGKSLRELAREFEVSPSAVRDWLLKDGISLRGFGHGKGGLRGSAHPKFGKPNHWGTHTLEAKQRIAQKGSKNPMYGKYGPAHGSWKDPSSRKTPVYKAIRFCEEYKQWRSSVFVRDDYTCQRCGCRGGELNADHIVPLSKLMKENGVTTLEAAKITTVLWDIENGQTLCVTCHRQTPSYGRNTE